MTDPIRARVLGVGPLSPNVVRLRLDAPGFTPLGVPDEACVVTFPQDGAAEAAASDPRSGHWYTVRRVAGDGSLTMDVVVHDGGAAAGWARRGRPGDVLQLWSQGSWFKRPADAAWQLFLVDTTGLPALGRAVEEAPAGGVTDGSRHPYTRALFSATPGLLDPIDPIPLVGPVPSATRPPSGCPFRTRCWKADGVCAEVMPEFSAASSPAHRYRCHHPVEEGEATRDLVRQSHSSREP